MCGSTGKTLLASGGAEEPASSSRIRFWEIDGGLHCSLVGTCLSHDDLVRIARKLDLGISPEATDHHLHSYFVQRAHIPGPLSRALQKLLEQRYAAIARRVRAAATLDQLTTLWEAECAAGRTAGAFWAFFSHRHVPEDLQKRIFGEVHMLSHLLGRTTTRTISLASELQARVDDLEARHARQQERNRLVLAERDAALTELDREKSLRQAAGTANVRVLNPRRSGATAAATERKERALLAARGRARSAEREIEVLKSEIGRLRLFAELRPTSIAAPATCPAVVACQETVQADIARRVLYIGGRTGGIDALRRVAASQRAEFIHHDGGEERSVKRIDHLIEGCDAVFCPIDCVSHSACLKAKALCRKLDKPFVPLRSSGAASFERALSSLRPLH